MATLVQELAQSIEKTTLATASNVGKGGMKMAKAFYDGAKPLHVKLAEGLDLTCPFEPSAFKGTGAEDRLSIVFARPRRSTTPLPPLSNTTATYWTQTKSRM